MVVLNRGLVDQLEIPYDEVIFGDATLFDDALAISANSVTVLRHSSIDVEPDPEPEINQTGNETSNQTTNQMGNETSNQTGNQTGNQTTESSGNETEGGEGNGTGADEVSSSDSALTNMVRWAELFTVIFIVAQVIRQRLT